jgi:hypothetical protein
MRIDRRLVGFGLFLVTVGVVMVAVRQGMIPDEAARRVWNLWPLILIGIGLSMILAGRPGAALGGLLVAVTFGAIVGGIAATGSFVPIGICSGDRSEGTSFAKIDGELSGSAQVEVEQACGDLTITTVAGSTWTLGGVADDDQPPSITSSPSELRITSGSRGTFDIGGGTAWDLALPRSPVLDLDVTTSAGAAQLELGGANLGEVSVVRNAGSLRLDLREVAAVQSVHLETNAGSATLWLPSLSLTGKLQANAGSIAICLPTGVGLRVDIGDSVAASNDFEAHGMTRNGDTWETPGYANAAVKIDLSAEANAASLSLDRSTSCAG